MIIEESKPKPPEGKHFLIVAEEWDEDDDGLSIEHSELCPKNDDSIYCPYDCNIGILVYEVGLDSYFLHRDAEVKSFGRKRLNPGRYEVESGTPPPPRRAA